MSDDAKREGLSEHQIDTMCGGLSRILHEMAGAASLCWIPSPSGEFDASRASEFVSAAIAEIRAALAAPASAQTPAGINAPEDLTVTGMDPRPAQTPAGERERFERWAAALDEPRYENGDYKNDHVQTQWEAWQAALFAGDRS